MVESDLDIQHLLEAMVNLGASDLHLTAGSPPLYRIDGELRPVSASALTPRQTDDYMMALAPTIKRAIFEERGTADFSYAINGVGRYRVNVYHQRGSSGLAIRLVSNRISTIEDLRLPPVVQRIAESRRGLVLVAGPSGSGKSSTVAAMIRHINDTRRRHILTIEDPIEYLHPHNRSIVNQIELGVDVVDMETALAHVMRQDPDVIVFGEIRDREALRVALNATETGHLVFSTMHTPDVLQTVQRLVNLFEPEEEALVLQEISLHLGSIVAQRLVRRADGKGRLPITEILINTPRIARLISEERFADLPALLQSGDEDMMTYYSCLVQLVRDGAIAMEEAFQYVDDEAEFRRSVAEAAVSGKGRALAG